VVGVEDQDNEIVDRFFWWQPHSEFSKCLFRKSPKIQWKRPFPQLTKRQNWLVTVKPKNNTSYFKRNTYYSINSVFIRHGSNTMPEEKIKKRIFKTRRLWSVLRIMLETTSNIPSTVCSILWILGTKIYNTKFLRSYLWFAGLEHRKNTRQDILSRVDIELINEQIKLFYSDQDVVTITYDEDTFTIIEYVSLGLNDKTSYYP
jgi:hypothetical protein